MAKFQLRCGMVFLALLSLGIRVNAEDAPKLDANGRKIYEAILDSEPPVEIQNDGTGFGLKLLRVSGHPRYDKPPNNGSIAEVIYDFKTPSGTNQLRLNFLIYPDSKSASEVVSGKAIFPKLFEGLPKGVLVAELSHTATTSFEREQPALFTVADERAIIKFFYQVDRVVITSITDAKFPGVIMPEAYKLDTNKLEKFADNEAKEMINHAWLLLADGKDVLDQPEIKALLH